MTLQEMYDTVLNHLRKQGRAAVSEEEVICVYRTDTGEKCAAGCLITDAAYDEDIEGAPIDGPAQAALFASGVPVNDVKIMDLLTELQIAHDMWMPWPAGPTPHKNINQWESAMKDIAATWSLTYTAPPIKVLVAPQIANEMAGLDTEWRGYYTSPISSAPL